MWDAVWEAVKDSLLILPVLIVTYVIIEIIEIKSSKSLKNSKLLKNKYATLVGSAFGIVPQCGFSVIATDLYTKKAINVGTLMAVYVATSDEAVPLLLSHPEHFKDLGVIIAIKFVMAVIIGYGANLFVKYLYKPKNVYQKAVLKSNFLGEGEINVKHQSVQQRYLVADINLEQTLAEDESAFDRGCCGHHIEGEKEKPNFWQFIYHPLVHCLKIFFFILIVNIVFEIILHYVGENTLMEFMHSVKYLQPLIAGIVGLIPNCASSVVITQLFIEGGLTLGACITGLSVNAGIAYTLLIKQNQNKKHVLYIISSIFVFALTVGILLTLIF